MKVKCTRGWGKVVLPESREEVSVEEPFTVAESEFDALRERYGGAFVVVDEPSDEPDDGDEPPDCLEDGCSRTVRGGGKCWQHEPDGG